MEFLDHLPAGFRTWSPLGQATLLFLGTFILEDVAAIGAGLLLGAGALAWPTAFWSCFLGIWIGDAGLYAIARGVGRKWFERSSFNKFAARVEQSERWFEKRGNSILVFSRLMPGARLPTYFAAGFLRVPLKRFLTITGSASFVWTVIVLLITQLVGAQALAWFGVFKQGSITLLISVAAILALLHIVKKAVRPEMMHAVRARILRLRHWEFWPAWLFYPPVGIYCLWLAVKYRGLTLPTAANPGIFSGGLVGESKMATLQDLIATSPDFTAEAEMVRGSTLDERLSALHQIFERRGFSYPYILKPDLGQRGDGVKLIRDAEQARAYLSQSDSSVLAQRYSPGPGEAGIFYYRFPGEKSGHIFAITEKIFPTVRGDGKSTIAELIRNDPRASIIAEKYLKRFANRHDEILADGELLRLVEAGNHAQGCIFRDGMHLCTPALIERIDAISQKLDGFFIGRYDIRYASAEELMAGRNFNIIELNGAASEATSIYDARNSVFKAYRMLFRQWELVFAIGAANRNRGAQPTPIVMVWKTWRKFLAQAATYPAAD